MSTSQTPPKITESFEVLVLGGRLSAFIAARLLSLSGYKVGLIYRESEPGQEYKMLETPHGRMAQGFRALPTSAEGAQVLEKLGQLLGAELSLQDLTSSGWQSLDGTKRKPFLGFGEQAPVSFPLLEGYLSAQSGYLNPSKVAEILALCSEGFTIISPAEVTDLQKQEQGWIVQIDHQRSYWADSVVYSEAPGQLFHLLKTPGQKPTKDQRHLTKWKGWTSLNLTLVHEPAEQELSPWILTSNKQEPTLGIFEPVTGEQQISHWLTFLDGELAASEEYCAAAYKEMRRQIKKIQPDLKVLWEKISIHPQSHGAPPLGEAQLDLGKGLYLMGPAFSTSVHPLWAELASSLKAYEAHQRAQGVASAAEAPGAEIHP